MKQLHKSSPTHAPAAAHAPASKASKASRPGPRSWVGYLLREQRLLFVLLGALIASSFFLLRPYLFSLSPSSHVPDRRPLFSFRLAHLVGVGRAPRVPPAAAPRRRHRRGRVRWQPPRRQAAGARGQRDRGGQLLHREEGQRRAPPPEPQTNVMGTLNMLGLAKRIGARFLLTSTSEVYGDPLEHPQKETYWGHVNPIGVRSCYDEGKRTAETLTMDYHRGGGVEVRIARIFNTYGPRMCLDDGRVVSNFVAQALRRQPMTVYGDGKQTRSFQYVSDLVAGLMALMEGDHIGPFNLGNPGEFTMLELAQVVKETIDPMATIEFKPNTADDPHMRKPDITKAKHLLRWEPKVSLREGLPLMVKDFRQRILDE
ncbi:hypothetical protein OsJ_04003 [Oryza sativa Japonica Group]|uniref:UDP-glucuronate decarboxylase n=1 Tax=Oryza sativa subsp. japonica TaxID=39947 RepID=A2ZZD2_ORYSJ|nr:hypothetical protein OsJ_04003 [Oryza sativa Japonica Group]